MSSCQIKKWNRIGFWGFVVIFLLFTLSVWFGNWMAFPYTFPPGDDPAAHLVITEKIMKDQWSQYPPLFHILTILVNKITGLELPTSQIFISLFLLGTCIPFGIFLISRRLWGLKRAVVISPLSIGLLPIITELYAHGQLPEIFAIFIVISLLFCLLLKNILLKILFLLTLFLTHPLTAFPVLFGILVLYAIRLKKKFIIWAPIALGIIFASSYLWPPYQTFFIDYAISFFENFNKPGAIVPIQDFLKVWRGNAFFLTALGIGLLNMVHQIFEKRESNFYLYITFWFVALVILSRVGYGYDFFSYRLVRSALFPALFIAEGGLVFVLSQIHQRYYVGIFILLLIAFIPPLITTISFEYLPQNYERIKQGDLSAINFIKEKTDRNALILFPGGSPAWWEYFSGRHFIQTMRSQKTLEPHDDYWKILDGETLSLEKIRSHHIQYIYQISPSTFYTLSDQEYMFDENNLVKKGNWKIIFENERVRLFQKISKKNDEYR